MRPTMQENNISSGAPTPSVGTSARSSVDGGRLDHVSKGPTIGASEAPPADNRRVTPHLERAVDVGAEPPLDEWFNPNRIAAQYGPNLPPMLQQYLEVKRAYSDCVVLFQVGDFYEIFFDDAAEVSRRINLTLTSRDKGKENPIPMCGVPLAHVESYVQRIVDTGLSCALVSQVTEADGKRGTVQRSLTKIVTPGVRILSEGAASSHDACCVAVAIQGDDCAIASTDVRSGEILVSQEVPRTELLLELRALSPSEILLPSRVDGAVLDRRMGWVRMIERVLPAATLKFRFEHLGEQGSAGSLSASSGSSQVTGNAWGELPGYAVLSVLAKRAVRGLISHVNQTTVTREIPFSRVSCRARGEVLRIDAMTRQNLEIVRNSRDGTEAGTLCATVDATVSEAGALRLRQWLLEPLIDPVAIEARLDAVDELLRSFTLREQLRAALKGLTDLDRLATRLELRAVGPRELGALRSALECALGPVRSASVSSSLLVKLIQNVPPLDDALGRLRDTLAESMPWSLGEGGVIRAGFDSDLDEIRAQRSGSSDWMAAFERAERARTGISSLKVKSNNVLGFFIEITRANAGKVPPDYQRRQSTAQAERFTTDALRAAEKDFFSAASREAARERVLFDELISSLAPRVAEIRAVGRVLAEVDTLAAFAVIAERYQWVRPTIRTDGGLSIQEGKHPVLAPIMVGSLVPNSVELDTQRRQLLVLTGPNMGGKSTYLRQVALITILGQAGSYVPAARAELGIVDQIFARIGASDNIAEGESTFMVEMREMTYILRNATSRSLVVIDEVGRGTATADGVSIAQAIVEHLVQRVGCRTLFATHFHELTSLDESLSRVQNISVTSIEQDGEVVFTHRISEGPASRSFGVEVAELAGLPSEVIERARQLLGAHGSKESLTKESHTREKRSLAETQMRLALHEGPRRDTELLKSMDQARKLQTRLAAIEIERTTPLEALALLAELKGECPPPTPERPASERGRP